jgi:cytoskeletal protein CcmA (bactofilin family)
METPQKIDDNSLESNDASSKQAIEDDKAFVAKKAPLLTRLVKRMSFINVYLLLFLLIILLAIIITYIGIKSNQKVDLKGRIDAQSLTTQSLNALSDSNTQIGDPKQTLTVASNSIFNGKVLFKDGIDVAGAIKVGGALNLPGITVSGTSNFESVLIGNTLTIGNDTTVSGNLTVLKSLTVSGGASFGGAISAAQLNIEKLTLNQDLFLNRHIKTSGATPNVSGGTATGNGGTTSLSGTDTAGTVTANIGGSPAAGVLANVTFATGFGTEPRVILTPVGSNAGSAEWYITKTTTGFSILTNVAPTAATSMSFDYIVVE